MTNPPDLENSVVKFGTGALQMQLAGWIYYPDSEDWYMGTSPFTIDFWARVDTIYTGQKHGFFQQRGDEDNYVDCWVEVFDNHYQLNFQIKAGGVLQVNASCFLASILHPPGYPATSSFLSNWVHIAIVRGWNGNPDSLALCVDGYGTVFTFTGSKIWPNLNDSFHIGGFWHIGDIYAQSFPGKIDEFRIVKGAAAWFGNFTPPSTPYDVSSATADPKYSLSLMRIYRLNQNASGAEYQFVAETALATEYYTDTVLDSSLGEILATTEWDGPPSGIKGLIALPDGSLAGFVDNILCRSVPRYPHAWPASYQKATEKPIVGLGAFGTTIVVLTESQPYLAVGDDPSNVVMEKVDPGFSCSSKRGIVQAGEVTLYPSPEGLSAIAPISPKF
jgi:hypothetical protein